MECQTGEDTTWSVAAADEDHESMHAECLGADFEARIPAAFIDRHPAEGCDCISTKHHEKRAL